MKLWQRVWMLVLIAWAIGLVVWAAILFAPKAHADMCGPSNLPVLSYLHPWVKGCQLYLPGAGNLPQLPVVPIPPPPNTPYPIWIPPWGSWARS